MYDLLYCDEHQDEVRAMVADDYPNAVIQNASDFMHPGRISVDTKCDDDEWLLWLMRKGIHKLSFFWGIVCMEEPERMAVLAKQVIEGIKENN